MRAQLTHGVAAVNTAPHVRHSATVRDDSQSGLSRNGATHGGKMACEGDEAESVSTPVSGDRILIVQLRQMGDVLVTTPVIRVLRQHRPRSHIAFLVERPSYHILSGNPYLDEILVLDRERYGSPFYVVNVLRTIRQKRFDLVFDFLGNPRSALIAYCSGARVRVGYDFRVRKHFYTHIVRRDVQPKYAVDFKMDALRAIGIDGRGEHTLDFFVPPEAHLFAEGFVRREGIGQNDVVIAVSPTSRRPYKRWPLSRFARVSDWLIAAWGAKILLLWGPGEREVVGKMRALMEREPIISPQTPTVKEVGALLERCAFLISNDNGTKHIAVALGVPTITIHGPSNPVNWTPATGEHIAVKRESGCVTCERTSCSQFACLEAVAVEDVKEAVVQLSEGVPQVGHRLECALKR